MLVALRISRGFNLISGESEDLLTLVDGDSGEEVVLRLADNEADKVCFDPRAVEDESEQPPQHKKVTDQKKRAHTSDEYIPGDDL